MDYIWLIDLKGGEMIKKRNIVISLILINILILSMSVVCASNETEINDIYSASLDDSLAIDNNN